MVEVLCAILVLGVGLVGLSQGVAIALQSNKESELQATAAMWAAGQIEMLRAEGGLQDGELEGDCGEGLSLYRWKESLTRTDLEGLHEVTVIVENAKTGKSIYELRTLLFEAPDELTASDSGKRRDSDKSRRRGR